MIKTLFLVIVIVFLIECVAMISILKQPTPAALSDCLLQILDTFFVASQKLSVNFFNESRFLANEILRKVRTPAIINTAEHRKDIGIDKGMLTDVVIILDETTDISFVLNTTLWYGDTVFLVTSSYASNLKNIFSEFWNNKIVNVYVLVATSGFNDSDDIIIYGYLPQSSNDCGTGLPILVDKYKNNKFETGDISQIKVTEKIKNMNGCRVNISVVDTKPYTIFDHNTSRDIDGVEGKIMLEISKHLNFTAWFSLPRDGEAWGYVKPQPAGAIGEVYTGYSDFTIGMLGPVIGRYENLDFSVSYCPMECVTFGVPKGVREKQKVWISFLISEFSGVVWFCLVSSVLITLTVSWIFLKFRRSEMMQYLVLITRISSSVIGVPAKYPIFKELKILFILWAYVSFLFTSAYQSSLSSKLAVPTADKDIETFEQLLESDLLLTGFKNIYTTLYYNREEKNIEKMLKRYVITNQSIENAIEVMSKERKIAYTRHKSSFIYYSLLHEDIRGTVNVLKDCIYIYYPTLMMKKYSPYTKQVNKIIDRLLRGGLIKHWISFYLYDVPQDQNPLIKLSVAKLKGIFFFWIGGLVVSILVFLGEVFYHKHFTLNSKLVNKNVLL